MKKLTLTAIAATLISLGAYGQGLVSFANSSGAASHISVNTTTGGAATGQFAAGNANSFYFALFYSTSATTVEGSSSAFIPVLGNNETSQWVWNDSNWTFAGNGSTYNVNGTVFTSGGYAASLASAGRVQTTLGTSTSVGGLGAGVGAQFVVVGWSSNIGTTWSAVQSWLAAPSGNNVYIGESAVSVNTLTGDNNTTPTPTILAATVVPAFTLGLANVPEPSTMALFGLGGLALLAFRRRQ